MTNGVSATGVAGGGNMMGTHPTIWHLLRFLATDICNTACDVMNWRSPHGIPTIVKGVQTGF